MVGIQVAFPLRLQVSHPKIVGRRETEVFTIDVGGEAEDQQPGATLREEIVFNKPEAALSRYPSLFAEDLSANAMFAVMELQCSTVDPSHPARSNDIEKLRSTFDGASRRIVDSHENPPLSSPCAGESTCVRGLRQVLCSAQSEWRQAVEAVQETDRLSARTRAVPVPLERHHDIELVITYPTFGKPSDDMKTAESIKAILQTSLHSRVTVGLCRENGVVVVGDRQYERTP